LSFDSASRCLQLGKPVLNLARVTFQIGQTVAAFGNLPRGGGADRAKLFDMLAKSRRRRGGLVGFVVGRRTRASRHRRIVVGARVPRDDHEQHHQHAHGTEQHS
jgi:hypothetical protein